MDDPGFIQIEGKTLAYSAQDVQKLTNEGCNLKVVDENVDDACFSDDDEGELDYFNEDADQQTKTERMRLEYISLALNSNQDPIKACSKSKFTAFDLGDQENELPTAKPDFGNECETYLSVHKSFRKEQDYEEIIKKYEEVSPNRVYKNRYLPGVGPVIDQTSIVIYNCALWTQKSLEPFDSSWLRNSTLMVDMANDSLLPGLYDLLLTMRRGEWAEAFLRPEAAFGHLGAMPRIPPSTTVFCVVEVVKVIPQSKLQLLSRNAASDHQNVLDFSELYEASDEARKRGNHYYEIGRYKVALQRYKSGIRILEALTYKDEEEELKGRELLLKLYNNTARTANASGNPRLALGASKQALELDDKSPKAHWNRVIAWKTKGHPDRALGAARRAMQLFPEPRTFKSFQREAEALQKTIRSEEADLKELHRLMGQSVALQS